MSPNALSYVSFFLGGGGIEIGMDCHVCGICAEGRQLVMFS